MAQNKNLDVTGKEMCVLWYTDTFKVFIESTAINIVQAEGRKGFPCGFFGCNIGFILSVVC